MLPRKSCTTAMSIRAVAAAAANAVVGTSAGTSAAAKRDAPTVAAIKLQFPFFFDVI